MSFWRLGWGLLVNVTLYWPKIYAFTYMRIYHILHMRALFLNKLCDFTKYGMHHFEFSKFWLNRAFLILLKDFPMFFCTYFDLKFYINCPLQNQWATVNKLGTKIFWWKRFSLVQLETHVTLQFMIKNDNYRNAFFLWLPMTKEFMCWV